MNDLLPVTKAVTQLRRKGFRVYASERIQRYVVNGADMTTQELLKLAGLARPRRKSNMSAWTPETEAILRRRWAEGCSSRVIAAEIGGGMTRNAVIGKTTRMGLIRGLALSEPAPEPIKELPPPNLPPPEPGKTCTMDGCRSPRQRGHRLGLCAEHITKFIVDAKNMGAPMPTPIVTAENRTSLHATPSGTGRRWP